MPGGAGGRHPVEVDGGHIVLLGCGSSSLIAMFAFRGLDRARVSHGRDAGLGRRTVSMAST
jgi:hypothetical protein